MISECIAIAWALTCLLGVGLGIAHFVLYYKDLKYQRKEWLKDYVDLYYDIKVVKKINNEDE